MLLSLRTAIAIVGIGLAMLSGCATPTQVAARCYWPNPMQQDCREMIEFNSWH